ncbi:type IV pilus modification PilV family protein [Roseibacillus ishigakijimensis]|uniref:Type II secretion system protein n=1 Tax=Roseibacillus ishigakijimensis TaxID=454146 RepID=A0A934RM51_9BACT|nr:type II secretion system protein [Roseibacillus ishigakijimensis]MBK1833320.1 type II secretion system protein [Roseibacillus ishigakijimensis]
MRTRANSAAAAGYTLTEVMLALAVVAIAVPLALGLVVAGGESSRRAEVETRAVMTARSVFEEIRRGLEGNSEHFGPDDLPWGTGAANSSAGGSIGSGGDDDEEEEDWLLLELNRDGEIVGLAEGMTYEEGWEGQDPAVVSLAAVRGYSQQVPDVEIVDGQSLYVFRIEIRIETPARATVENREREVFIKSDSLR